MNEFERQDEVVRLNEELEKITRKLNSNAYCRLGDLISDRRREKMILEMLEDLGENPNVS